MPLVSLDKLAAGMVAKNDIKDRSGRVLLRAGTEISERSLRVLRTWGIPSVEVEGEGADEDDAQQENFTYPPEVLAEAQSRMEKMFCRVDLQHPAAKRLSEVVVERLAAEISGRADHGC